MIPTFPYERFFVDSYDTNVAVEWVEHSKQPVEIEIGCNNGWFTSQMAIAWPKRRVLGVEIQEPLARQASRELFALLPSDQCNGLILRHEAPQFLASLSDECVSTVHVYFPTPLKELVGSRSDSMFEEAQTEELDGEKQLVSRMFVDEIYRVLVKDGTFRLVTDKVTNVSDSLANETRRRRWRQVQWQHPFKGSRAEYSHRSLLAKDTIGTTCEREYPLGEKSLKLQLVKSASSRH